MSSSLSPSAKKIRRAHRKSRLGCQHCKKRKIKCDETWPVCRNCIRSDATCIYQPHPRQSSAEVSSTTPPSVHDALQHGSRQRHDLDTSLLDRDKQLEAMSRRLGDLEAEIHQLKCQQPLFRPQDGDTGLLLRYYRAMMANDTSSFNAFWNEDLPSLGKRHRHVLHLMLGLAALYHAKSIPDRYDQFISIANHHHGLGLTSAIALMNNGGSGSRDEAVSTATCILISLHTLALGPQPDDYMAFSTKGRPNLLVLIRAFRALREDQLNTAGNLPTAPTRKPEHLPPTTGRAEYQLQFLELQKLIHDTHGPVRPEFRSLYLMALEHLLPFYNAAYDSEGPSNIPISNAQQPLGWLYCVPETYLSLLEAKEPVALIIFAYFSVILERVKSHWPVRGWSRHIISRVESLVPEPLQRFVKWPSEQVKVVIDDGFQ
ncbi:hypothetical protein BKA59DRAFT_428764 [Fusarium tricinctum]|uniref:Zn(2)-C6 fungal-type domain-containing protein n=1 Tax=Fusarium tricinctum TaxID=61284 RepID=A0A8K0RN95_9HYPO|nr:hypothetical protein BKA59DRAFT_428764 [Fusarium tricinctum]